MDNIVKSDNYDAEPVVFCSRCYSLKVKYEESTGSEYCGTCGCTDIQEAPFPVWEKKYEDRYRHKFVEKNEDPKKSFVFNLSFKDLKRRVYESPQWKEIIKQMFPNFPEGYSKADSIILFFDTVVKKNKTEELRLLLFKLIKY